jgi:hypothetical protein
MVQPDCLKLKMPAVRLEQCAASGHAVGIAQAVAETTNVYQISSKCVSLLHWTDLSACQEAQNSLVEHVIPVTLCVCVCVSTLTLASAAVGSAVADTALQHCASRTPAKIRPARTRMVLHFSVLLQKPAKKQCHSTQMYSRGWVGIDRSKNGFLVILLRINQLGVQNSCSIQNHSNTAANGAQGSTTCSGPRRTN